MAELYQKNNEFPKALEAYHEALEIYKTFAAENPKV